MLIQYSYSNVVGATEIELTYCVVPVLLGVQYSIP